MSADQLPDGPSQIPPPMAPEYADVNQEVMDRAMRTGQRLSEVVKDISRSGPNTRGAGVIGAANPGFGHQYGGGGEDDARIILSSEGQRGEADLSLQDMDRVDSMLAEAHQENDAHTIVNSGGFAKVNSSGYREKVETQPGYGARFTKGGKSFKVLNDEPGAAPGVIVQKSPEDPYGGKPWDVVHEFSEADAPRAKKIVEGLQASTMRRTNEMRANRNVETAQAIIDKANAPRQATTDDTRAAA